VARLETRTTFAVVQAIADGRQSILMEKKKGDLQDC
jgi:hypothetical protein